MKIDSKSSEGNAFNIIGQVTRFLKSRGRTDEVDSVIKEMTSGDYENLCQVVERVTDNEIVIIR
jgi:hypothetical protein